MHDKTNKLKSAPSECSDQPGHQPSLIRLFIIAQRGATDLWLLRVYWEDSDQTGRSEYLLDAQISFDALVINWLECLVTTLEKYYIFISTLSTSEI